jgi:protein associated with RNAse G/E
MNREHNQLTIDRAEFIENTKQWVTLDSQLKIINEKTKKIRDMKRELTEKICKYKDKHPIHSTIKLSDGELKFYEKKEQTPLSFGYIEHCLEQILQDQTQIDFVMDYIKNNREVTTVTDIKRIYSKN